MSEQTPADQLPRIPETQIIEPIVQCGVLYLGSAPPSPGRRGIDSVQEPFSRRYPIDGTNTARGIDAVLSIYDNGIQLAFARHPHAVIFFPISSLIYCASLRFSTVESDLVSGIDWRFVTLDSTVSDRTKHPPLFCAVVQRTQIIPGEECHCFITKNDDAALALVRTISEVYANLTPNFKPLRSPIFYQLDRYGRKISETTGIIYITPATDDESKITDPSGSVASRNRTYLLDSTSDGFFYRTDASVTEQWQLWDNNDSNESRPRPPASPFGQNQGLYHDDLTDELHGHLRHMDDEENSSSSSCSCSSSSSSSVEYDRSHHSRQDSKHDNNNNNPFNPTNTQASAFDPSLSTPAPSDSNRFQQRPIIIEKVAPYSMMNMPLMQPQFVQEQPQPPPSYSIPSPQTSISYAPISAKYHINERGEKVTEEGNRILYMDVFRPDPNNPNVEPHPFSNQTPRPRSHRRKSSQIPVVDLQSLERLVADNRIPEVQQPTMMHRKEKKSRKSHRAPSDSIEIVEEYFEDHKGRRIQLNSYDSQTILEYLEYSSKKKNGRSSSQSHQTPRRRRNRSTLVTGPQINYVERPSVRPERKQASVEPEQPAPNEPVFNNEKVNDYVSNVYGLYEKRTQKAKSPSLSSNHQSTNLPDNMAQLSLEDQEFISPFRYMQSSINPSLLREYRKAFTGN